MTAAAPIVALWAEFKRTGARADRDRLIVHYSPLVKYVAGKVGTALPDNIDQGDLIGYGIFGLIDAIDRFDPSRDVRFETYATVRIKGSIIDELRRIDWVPRAVRNHARALQRAFSSLESRFGRAPTDAELAVELDMSEEQFDRVLTQVSVIGSVALDQVAAAGSDDAGSATVGDRIADNGLGPADLFEIADTRRFLAGTVDRLGDREKTVVMLYYYERLTLSQIGEILGVTDSRVSQIHAKAVLEMRARVTNGRTAA